MGVHTHTHTTPESVVLQWTAVTLAPVEKLDTRLRNICMLLCWGGAVFTFFKVKRCYEQTQRLNLETEELWYLILIPWTLAQDKSTPNYPVLHKGSTDPCCTAQTVSATGRCSLVWGVHNAHVKAAGRQTCTLQFPAKSRGQSLYWQCSDVDSEKRALSSVHCPLSSLLQD